MFNFNSKHQKHKRKKRFYGTTRRVGAQDGFHSQVGMDDCMKARGKKTEQPIAIRREIRLWVLFN